MSHKSKGKVAVVGSCPDYLVNLRGQLIEDIARAGYKVLTLSTGAANNVLPSRFTKLGVKHVSYEVERNGLNPLSDLKTLLQFRRIFKTEKPCVLIAYTIKPVIWGGIASRVIKDSNFFALITGLGYAFQGGNWKRNFLSKVVCFLYKLSLSRAQKVFFQNTDNLELFVKRGIVEREKCFVVNGSGVDLKHFSFTKQPSIERIRFLCIARLLGEKGLREYAEAAKQVKSIHPSAEFLLVGKYDSSPDGISPEEVRKWEQHGVQYMGGTDDVRQFIAESNVYVLPSYHEGTPRTVLEAMAMGRPIITTDTSGCRDTTEHGVNGFLVPVKSVESLKRVMTTYICDPKLIALHGQESRKIAEQKYDVHKVNSRMLELMGL